MPKQEERQQLPWFAVLGVVALASLFMFCTKLSNFGTELVPIYFTEALLFIAVGYFFYKGHNKQGWLVFLMALLWFLNQAICWGAPANLSIIMWFLFVGQAGLTYAFFTNQKVKILNPVSPTAEAWGYSALFIVLFYALGKVILNVMYGWGLLQMIGWGLAVLLTSVGYIFPKHEYSGYLKVVGVLIAVVSALTIQGPGLTLLG